MAKGWLVVIKKEMANVRIDEKFVPVTLVQLVWQEIVRFKNEEKDGYVAAVIGVGKKKKTTKGTSPYKKLIEFSVDENFLQANKKGDVIDEKILEWVEEVNVVGTSKGKWFQWVMKRFHAKGWPKTHGSKFHRQIGSLGNRKPRRVQKWHPHAGRMGGERRTLQHRKVVEIIEQDGEKLILIQGSLPWSYNGMLQLIIK